MKRIFYILLYLSNFSFSQEIKTNADTIIIGDHITINIKAEFKIQKNSFGQTLLN